MPNVTLQIQANRAILTFDREGASANLFDGPTLEELSAHLDRIAARPEVSGLVIRSAKPRIFIAGADLKVLASARGEELRKLIELGQQTFQKLADLKCVTIAAIHGACVGGGCELALACDWRVASDSSATKIGLTNTWSGVCETPPFDR